MYQEYTISLFWIHIDRVVSVAAYGHCYSHTQPTTTRQPFHFHNIVFNHQMGEHTDTELSQFYCMYECSPIYLLLITIISHMVKVNIQQTTSILKSWWSTKQLSHLGFRISLYSPPFFGTVKLEWLSLFEKKFRSPNPEPFCSVPLVFRHCTVVAKEFFWAELCEPLHCLENPAVLGD